MLVVGVGGDGGQVGLGQVDVIDFAVLVQLQAHGQVGDHGDGVMLETGAVVCGVVVGVGDEALGVLLDVLLDEVRTIVPHGGVVAGAEAIDAQLVDEVLRGGVEAVVGNDSVEVGAGVLAGEDQSVVVRCLDADTGSQHILVGHVSSSVALVLGQVVVLGSAHDGLRRHGGVESLVLEGVQDPLKTHEEVLGGQVRLDLAVDVAPIDIVAQVEGPDGGVLVVLPAGCDGGHCLAVAVEAQQAVPAVGGDVQVGSGLAVQEVPGLQLTVGSLEGDVIGDGVGCRCSCAGGSTGGAGSSAAGRTTASGQDACSAHDAGSLEEAAAADGMRLKICVHCVFLPIILSCLGSMAQGTLPCRFPTLLRDYLPSLYCQRIQKSAETDPSVCACAPPVKSLTRHILYHRNKWLSMEWKSLFLLKESRTLHRDEINLLYCDEE